VKGLPTLIRLRKFELEEKRRALAEKEAVAAEIERQINALDEAVVREQDAARRSQEVAFAYPAFARMAIDRRRDLIEALAVAQREVEEAAEEVTIAYQELKKFEVAQANRIKREKYEASIREQNLLDEMAIESFRRAPH
jgi:flagellar FliJ protein